GPHLRTQACSALETVGDVARRREPLACLRERHAVEPLNGATRCAILRTLPELAQGRAVELVRLTELMQQPHDLVAVPDGVGRKLRRDHEVDRASVRLVEVEQPPEKGLAQHTLARIPLVGNRDEIGLVSARAELGYQIFLEDLGAAAGERDLRRADRDSHPTASRCTRVFTGNPPPAPLPMRLTKRR